MFSTVLLQAADGGIPPQAMNIVFIVGMIAVFYFFMIRPQQKKQKDQKNFSDSLKKGDEVVTIGGIHGKIAAIDGETISLEIDKGVKMRIQKSSISLENSKPAPAKK